MAHKAFNPYQPEFRTVNKVRGKSTDPSAISGTVPQRPDVFDSVYVKDYIKSKDKKPRGTEVSVSAEHAAGRSLDRRNSGFKVRHGKALLKSQK